MNDVNRNNCTLPQYLTYILKQTQTKLKIHVFHKRGIHVRQNSFHEGKYFEL